MAATCVFLACKVEEAHRKLPSIIDATMASLDKSPEGVQKWNERSYRANPNSKVRAMSNAAVRRLMALTGFLYFCRIDLELVRSTAGGGTLY